MPGNVELAIIVVIASAAVAALLVRRGLLKPHQGRPRLIAARLALVALGAVAGGVVLTTLQDRLVPVRHAWRWLGTIDAPGLQPIGVIRLEATSTIWSSPHEPPAAVEPTRIELTFVLRDGREERLVLARPHEFARFALEGHGDGALALEPLAQVLPRELPEADRRELASVIIVLCSRSWSAWEVENAGGRGGRFTPRVHSEAGFDTSTRGVRTALLVALVVATVLAGAIVAFVTRGSARGAPAGDAEGPA